VRLCPDDPQGWQRVGGSVKGTSYVINEYVAVPLPDAALNINKLQATSKLILMFEGADNRKANGDHVHTSTWYEPGNIESEIVWLVITSEIKPDRHVGATANYLYADGHVDTIGQETVYGWVQRDIAQGTNFAKPVR
jgi:prepilin-type processing-associated H-X9-DG protein